MDNRKPKEKKPLSSEDLQRAIDWACANQDRSVIGAIYKSHVVFVRWAMDEGMPLGTEAYKRSQRYAIRNEVIKHISDYTDAMTRIILRIAKKEEAVRDEA